jgi:hypothetical protein
MAKVLVLGNDPQINSIDFEKIHPNIVTLGVNRIWLKFIPNYFFFSDLIISNELSRYPEKLEELKRNSTIYSSDWLQKNIKNKIPGWTKVYSRKNTRLFPDSISNAIDLFNANYIPNSIFYIAGVSLKWQDPSHFWKKSNSSSNQIGHSVGADWYLPRFEKIKFNMQLLKSKGISMVSVNPNSSLNSFLRYESIETLYR